MMAFSAVTPCCLVEIYQHFVGLAASVFRVEDGGRMFLQTADIFLPEYRFRSQTTFIITIAMRTSNFTTQYLITGAFQNLAFSSCVYISCHDDDDDGGGGSDGSSSGYGGGGGGDDDVVVMSMEAH